MAFQICSQPRLHLVLFRFLKLHPKVHSNWLEGYSSWIIASFVSPMNVLTLFSTPPCGLSILLPLSCYVFLLILQGLPIVT